MKKQSKKEISVSFKSPFSEMVLGCLVVVDDTDMLTSDIVERILREQIHVVIEKLLFRGTLLLNDNK